jgi:hypothetical protein
MDSNPFKSKKLLSSALIKPPNNQPSGLHLPNNKIKQHPNLTNLNYSDSLNEQEKAKTKEKENGQLPLLNNLKSQVNLQNGLKSQINLQSNGVINVR